MRLVSTDASYGTYFLLECGSGWWGIWSRLPPDQQAKSSQPQTNSSSMDEDQPLGSLPQGPARVHWC